MASKTVNSYSEVVSAGKLREDATFPEIRKRLAPRYRHLPTEYIEQIIEQNFGEGVNPEDLEGFFSDIGNAVKGALPTVLPIAGTVLGTAFGGPVGGALGGTLGSALGGAISPSAKPGAPAKPATSPMPGIMGAVGSAIGAQPVPGSNPAAAQLLKTLFNPKVVQGLQSMALGQAGKQAIPVAGTQVSLGSLANMLSSLLAQATEEHHRIQAQMGESTSSYLLNSEGYPVVDPSIPEQRAAALLNLLQQESINRLQEQGNYQQRNAQRQGASRRFRQDQEDIDHYYDMLELASLHEDLDEWEIH